MLGLAIANIIGGGSGGVGVGSSFTRDGVITKIRAAGRFDPIFGRATDSGIHFKDRAGVIPWVPGANLEQQILASIPVTSLPPGVLPWRLGANVWNDAATTVFGESQVLGGGRYRLFSSAGAVSGVQNPVGTIDAKKAYICTFFVESVSVPGGGLAFMDFGTIATATPGWKAAFLPPGSANNNTGPFIKRNSGATDIVVSRMTVQEVIYDWSWCGPNLVTNGGLADATGWTVPAGWSVSGGTANATATGASLLFAHASTNGKTYRIEFDVTAYTSGTLFVTIGANYASPSSFNSVGRKVAFVSSGTSITRGVEFYGGGVTCSIDNVVVQEVPGYPHIAPTAGGVRPSGRYNLLQRVEDIMVSPWTNALSGTGVAPTVSNVAGVSPNGTSATRVQLSLNGGTTTSDIVRRCQAFTPTAVSHRYSIWLRSFDGTSTYNVHIVGAGAATSNVVVTGAWTRYEIDAIGTGASVNFSVGLRGGQTPANSNTADILVWGADLRLSIYTGSAYPSYQRVGDGSTGVFDYDATGFPVWIGAAATNAGLHSVGLVDMSGTDAARMGVVLVKTVEGVNEVFAELSANSNVNAGALMLSNGFLIFGAGNPGVGFRSRGSITSNAVAPRPSAVDVVGVVAAAKISTDLLSISVNGGAAATQATDQGAGNYGAYRYHCFGRSLDSSPSLPFTGRMVTVGAHLVGADLITEQEFAEGVIKEDATAVGHSY